MRREERRLHAKPQSRQGAQASTAKRLCSTDLNGAARREDSSSARSAIRSIRRVIAAFKPQTSWRLCGFA
jgi:hypothetical protein